MARGAVFQADGDIVFEIANVKIAGELCSPRARLPR